MREAHKSRPSKIRTGLPRLPESPLYIGSICMLSGKIKALTVEFPFYFADTTVHNHHRRPKSPPKGLRPCLKKESKRRLCRSACHEITDRPLLRFLRKQRIMADTRRQKSPLSQGILGTKPILRKPSSFLRKRATNREGPFATMERRKKEDAYVS